MIIRQVLNITRAKKDYKRSKRAARMKPEPQTIEKPIIKKNNSLIAVISIVIAGSILAVLLIKNNKK